MALQYTIWTMAANRHEKYRHYHDAFYRRARRYLEEDELRVCQIIREDGPSRHISLIIAYRETGSTSSPLLMLRPGHSWLQMKPGVCGSLGLPCLQPAVSNFCR